MHESGAQRAKINAVRRAAVVAAGVAIWACATAAVGAEPGVTVRQKTIEHDGIERFYLVAEPDSFCPGAPAVVVLHGGSQSMRTILEDTAAPSRWLDIASEFGVAVIVPNGYNVNEEDASGDRQTWNDLRSSVGTPISEEDDAGFIAAAVGREWELLGFDRRAVFVTGSSNGGMMAQRMLIEFPGVFAGGASFIANLPEVSIPDPASPTPIMIMNGDADPLMPWEGGTVGFNGAPVRSTLDTAAYWRRVNGVADVSAKPVLLPDVDPSDGVRILEAASTEAGASAPDVVLYRMINGGHAIPVLPGDPQNPLPPGLGTRGRDVRGVDVAWRFFQRHTPETEGDLNGDASVDIFDALTFLRWFDAGVPAADVNCDGRIDAADTEAALSLISAAR